MKNAVSLNNITNEIFQSQTHGKVKLDEIISIIKDFLEEDISSSYIMVIGSDSQEREKTGNSKIINLVTAILIHRKGFGGKYFWKRNLVGNIHTLREKIYTETMASLNFATAFVPLLKKSLNGKSPNYKLEIHVDVGEHGNSRDMIKEVVGMVTGNGFIAKTKPEAYTASYVADKHT